MATIYDNLPRNKILLAILNAYGGVATNPSSQDAILADIVVACGGVVTNPNNRNSLLADIVEATSGCNVYPFSSADADYLEIAPFTGNFKIILAATSEVGIPASIQAGLQGSFIPSADPVSDPQWNQYEIDGAVPAVVLEATFTGVCGGYAKDDVWSYVDMGSPITRWLWSLNGTSYGVAPAMQFEDDFDIYAEVNTSQLGSDWAIFDTASVDNLGGVLMYVDNPDGLEVIIGDGADFDRYIFGGQDAICNGENNTIGVHLSGGTLTATLNGLPLGSPEPVTIRAHAIEGLVFGGASRFMVGQARALKVTGITNLAAYPSGTANWKLDEPYSDAHIATDSDNGVIMNKFNDLPEDYIEGVG